MITEGFHKLVIKKSEAMPNPTSGKPNWNITYTSVADGNEQTDRVPLWKVQDQLLPALGLNVETATAADVEGEVLWGKNATKQFKGRDYTSMEEFFNIAKPPAGAV